MIGRPAAQLNHQFGKKFTPEKGTFLSKEQVPHTSCHQLLRVEAQLAAAPDRLYPVRSNKYYGFYAGQLPDMRQALAALDSSKNLLVVIFDRGGNVVDVQRKSLAASLNLPPEEWYMTVNDAELHEYLHNQFGFTPELIRVKAFLVPEEGLSVHAFPSHYDVFLADPMERVFDDFDRENYPGMIRGWIAEKAFVLDWGNDYWLDDEGEVASS